MIENVVIASLNFTKAQAVVILSSDDPAPATALLQEFFAALLNTLKGADTSAIDTALIEASDWLNAHPAGVELSQAELEQAEGLIQTLGDYNTGFIGPGHCPDEPLTPTPVSSPTGTATATPTIRPIQTFKPSPTATESGGGSGSGGDGEPTEPPAATNTSPPPPPPTNTLPPPPPTNTPEPPPPTPTEPPPPPTDTPGG
jgi:hypothetical protein